MNAVSSSPAPAPAATNSATARAAAAASMRGPNVMVPSMVLHCCFLHRCLVHRCLIHRPHATAKSAPDARPLSFTWQPNGTGRRRGRRWLRWWRSRRGWWTGACAWRAVVRGAVGRRTAVRLPDRELAALLPRSILAAGGDPAPQLLETIAAILQRTVIGRRVTVWEDGGRRYLAFLSWSSVRFRVEQANRAGRAARSWSRTRRHRDLDHFPVVPTYSRTSCFTPASPTRARGC